MKQIKQHFWRTGQRKLPLNERTLIMGIVNVTPDSFSDGGLFFECDQAVRHALMLIDQGADIIDIGGESTRPGSAEVSVAEEIARVAPVIEKLRAQSDVVISIDTWKSEVARAAVDAGADVINDIYALQGDPGMLDLVRTGDMGVILMNHPAYYRPQHKRSLVFPQRKSLRPIEDTLKQQIDRVLASGSPNRADREPAAIVQAELIFLRAVLADLRAAGVDDRRIVLDPGIGFGLTVDENLCLIQQLDQLKNLGYPVLLAPSRKRFIRQLIGESGLAQEQGTAAALVYGIRQGADLVRVHDVAYQKPFISMADALKYRSC